MRIDQGTAAQTYAARLHAQRSFEHRRLFDFLNNSERCARYAEAFAQSIEEKTEQKKAISVGVGKVLAEGVLLPSGYEWLQAEMAAKDALAKDRTRGGIRYYGTKDVPLGISNASFIPHPPDALWVLEEVDELQPQHAKNESFFAEMDLPEDPTAILYQTLIAEGIPVNSDTVFAILKGVFDDVEQFMSRLSYYETHKGAMKRVVSIAFSRKYFQAHSHNPAIDVLRYKDQFVGDIQRAIQEQKDTLQEEKKDVFFQDVQGRLMGALNAAIRKRAVYPHTDQIKRFFLTVKERKLFEMDNIPGLKQIFSLLEEKITPFFGDTDAQKMKPLEDIMPLLYMKIRLLEKKQKDMMGSYE